MPEENGHDRIYSEIKDVKGEIRGMRDDFTKFSGEYGSLVSRLDEFRTTAKDQISDLFTKWNDHVKEHQQDRDTYLGSINEIKQVLRKIQTFEDAAKRRIEKTEDSTEENRTHIGALRQDFAGALGTVRGIKWIVGMVIAVVAALGGYMIFLK